MFKRVRPILVSVLNKPGSKNLKCTNPNITYTYIIYTLRIAQAIFLQFCKFMKKTFFVIINILSLTDVSYLISQSCNMISHSV